VTNKTAASRYARALFDVAVKEKANLEEIDAQLEQFRELFAGHPPLEKVLLNPAVPAPRKRAVVAELVSRARPATPLAKLMLLLAERDRLILLADLQAAFRQRLLDRQNVVRAEVTTTVALPADRAKQIERSLAAATGRSVTLSTRVDPSLIGGAVTRIGGTVYDGSISTQLKRMKERLEAGS
jgi:F-type H+-transporting ATPase subunit delta